MSKKLICLIVLSLIPSSLIAGEFDREIHRTGSGLKYRGAVVSVSNSCSAVCVDPSGVYLSANHCDFIPGTTYKTNVDNLYLKCLYNTRKMDGVSVLKEEGNKEVRDYFRVASTEPKVGDTVYAIGFPNGKFAYHEGKLSRTSRNLGDGNLYYVMNQRLFEGHSGGPLLNDNDELIGVLSSRSLLSSEGTRLEFSTPESMFLSLPVINTSLKAAKVNPTGQGKPTVVVLTIPNCGPCASFKRDYFAGRLPSQYDFVVVTWNGVSWDNPSYANAYKQKFGRFPDNYPTFWVVGTDKAIYRYDGPPSLIGFIRGSIGSISDLLLGPRNDPGNGLPLLPAPPTEPPENPRLLEKIEDVEKNVEKLGGLKKELEGEFDKRLSPINEGLKGVEGQLSQSEGRFSDIKSKIESIFGVINEIKGTKQTSEDSGGSGLGTLFTILGVAKNFGPIGLLGGLGVGGLVWGYRKWRSKKKSPPPSSNPPISIPSTSTDPSVDEMKLLIEQMKKRLNERSPPSTDQVCVGERLMDRFNRLESLLQKDSPPKSNTGDKVVDIQHRYMPYEVEKFKEAVAYAHENCAKKYPGSVGTLEYLDSLVDQFLNQENSKDK